MTPSKGRPKSASGEQGRKFVEAARELGTDESEDAFDHALRKVASAPPAPMHKPKKVPEKGKKHTSR